MKSIKIYKPIENSHVTTTSDIYKNIDLLDNLASAFDSYYSYKKEKEKTEQVSKISLARIIESNNRLEEVRLKEVAKRLEIYKDAMKELLHYKNEEELRKIFKEIIQQEIDYLNFLKDNYKETKHTDILDKIHEIHLKLLEMIKYIK